MIHSFQLVQAPLTPEDSAIIYGTPATWGRTLGQSPVRLLMVKYDREQHDQWTVLTLMVLAGLALASYIGSVESGRIAQLGRLN